MNQNLPARRGNGFLSGSAAQANRGLSASDMGPRDILSTIFKHKTMILISFLLITIVSFGAILIYLALGLVALLVDRRALLVSALGYVMFALSSVLKASGVIGQDLAYTALVAGAALLLLSAFWHKARQLVFFAIPAGLRRRLPAT